MIKIERILCPTDLSSESDEALRYALALARAYKAKLILLYCRRPASVVEWANVSNAARLFEQMLYTHLDANEMKALDWEAAIAEGEDVGRAIVAEASKRSVDLIVMRSRRRPHAAALFGSTAETISRYASCPVLVVHHDEREWVGLSAGDIDLKRVLVTSDFSPDSQLALNYGIALAEEYQTELHFLHVLDRQEQDPPEFSWVHVDLESRYAEAARRLRDAIPSDAALWCKVVPSVRWGNIAEEILSYAKQHEIDLICVGVRRPGFDLNKLFGSTTEHVLRRAGCPILVARSAVAAAASVKAA